MYQALVVDDEKEIREGLAAWDWGALPVKVVGSCAHGLEALRFLASTPVDFLLTDIRMPFMDGIELMEVVSHRYPFIRTIVLSGYSEFEYARRAMQLGAADYLLKPVSSQDMAATVGRLIARMDAEKQLEHRRAVLERRARQLAPELRRAFLDALFGAAIPAEELEQGGVASEVLLDGNAFAAAIVRMDGPAPQSQDMDALAFSLDSILERSWDERGLGYHQARRDAVQAVLLSKDGADSERFERLQAHLLKYRSLFRATFSIVVGPTVPSPSLLHRSLAAARQRADAAPASAVTRCPAESLDSGAPRAAAGAAPARLDSALLRKAKQFMQENYTRTITLKDVADHVYVSPGYLSALFKANDETFLKALTALRVDRARELLADPSLKIYEIVGMVGYSDAAYFTEVFKRQTGITPIEYRNGSRAGG